jgi:hypothetical protein
MLVYMGYSGRVVGVAEIALTLLTLDRSACFLMMLFKEGYLGDLGCDFLNGSLIKVSDK